MISETIRKLTELAVKRPNLSVEIYHTKRRTNHRVTGFRKIDIDGLWHTYIDYEDVNTGEKYARHAMNFNNFNEAK